MSRLCKKMYAVQPYQVGPKNKKSLAVVIPSKLAKEFGVDTSTIFATYVDKSDNTISLQMVRAVHKNALESAKEGLSATQRHSIKDAER
jgi:antitoxin component of MazEF toxin-antitoxin module